jgi:hypothetical protein
MNSFSEYVAAADRMKKRLEQKKKHLKHMEEYWRGRREAMGAGIKIQTTSGHKLVMVDEICNNNEMRRKEKERIHISPSDDVQIGLEDFFPEPENYKDYSVPQGYVSASEFSKIGVDDLLGVTKAPDIKVTSNEEMSFAEYGNQAALDRYQLGKMGEWLKWEHPGKWVESPFNFKEFKVGIKEEYPASLNVGQDPKIQEDVKSLEECDKVVSLQNDPKIAENALCTDKCAVALGVTPEEKIVPITAAEVKETQKEVQKSLKKGNSMFKSLFCTLFGSAVTLTAIFYGPTAGHRVAKYFEPPPLSPLAKVVLEKLETSTWEIQNDGIVCDTLWIRGQTLGNNNKSLTDPNTVSCSVFIRSAAYRNSTVNEQLQEHELKLILPKAKAVYESLLLEANAATANSIVSKEGVQGTSKKRTPFMFSKLGKTIYDNLDNKSLWKVHGSKNKDLISKDGDLSIDCEHDLDRSPLSEIVSISRNEYRGDTATVPLSLEEKQAIQKKAVQVRDEVLVDKVQNVFAPKPVITVDLKTLNAPESIATPGNK